MKDSPRIAVLGAGAVGCYFGGMLARAGVPVTLVGRATHVDAIRRDGLDFDSVHFHGRIPLQASTDPAAVAGADFVLLCVKARDTVNAARGILPHLALESSVVSLQNGVENVDRLRAELSLEAISSVVYVAAAMAG